jgi:hypothetical protein
MTAKQAIKARCRDCLAGGGYSVLFFLGRPLPGALRIGHGSLMRTFAASRMFPIG